MKPESSLPPSQQLAPPPYPELDQSTFQHIEWDLF
jgi:hypothetical protein